MNEMHGPAPEHLILAPILIPLIAGALMLFYDETRRRAKLVISLGSSLLLLAVAIELLTRSEGSELTGNNDIGFYLLGDWPVPFGILLVLDRLSAMMLVLVALLATPAVIFAAAGTHRQGPHFHSMLQFLLMGLNGAFLTGDLFNLFVFFELLLAASYGLLLHGTGQLRVRTGLHYIAINLAASLLFLLGIALLYGVTGTLNMADLAARAGVYQGIDARLMMLGAGFMAMAFLVKAAMWPFSFWLPSAYGAAAAPVAAIFAVMTKVGIYALLRLGMLVFGPAAAAHAGFGAEVLIWGGMATMLFGILGLLGAQTLSRMAGYLVLVSSGTLLTAVGLTLSGSPSILLASALFYLLASTLGTSALFLLVEPMSRDDGGIAALLAVTAEAYGIEDPKVDQAEVGVAVPGPLAVLGISFGICVLLLAGFPPFPGFLGKIGMITGTLSAVTPEGIPGGVKAGAAWGFVALLILSGLATIIALGRIGMQTLWAQDNPVPRLLALEIAPVVVLLGMAVFLTVKADTTMRYMDKTARALTNPQIYVAGVLGTERVAKEEVAPIGEGSAPQDPAATGSGSAPAAPEPTGSAPADPAASGPTPAVPPSTGPASTAPAPAGEVTP